MKLWYEKGAWASQKAKNSATLMKPELIRSIAIIRHAAIGDMMVLRPFLIHARAFFPNASITLSIVNNYSYGVPIDLVDRVHTVHKKIDGKKTSWSHRFKEIKELGEHDIIFEMADTAVSGLVCLLNKAKLKIGFPYRRAKNAIFDVSILRSDLIPEVETLLQMLYIIGAPKMYQLEYGYPALSANKSDPYIVYFTSASLGWKCWPKEHFTELIDEMAIRYPEKKHIALEGILDYEKVDDLMLQLAHHSNVVKVEALPLDQVISFLGKASLVVSGDTGIRNMAIATETDTVGIFFFTVPYRYLPFDRKHQAVFNSDGSIPDVERVLNTITKLLERT
jgi:ADP-heptose:LPS heptosyltransferase